MIGYNVPIDTKVKAFVVTGATGFAASKFVFGASTKTAVIIGAILGAITIAAISISFPQNPTIPTV